MDNSVMMWDVRPFANQNRLEKTFLGIKVTTKATLQHTIVVTWINSCCSVAAGDSCETTVTSKHGACSVFRMVAFEPIYRVGYDRGKSYFITIIQSPEIWVVLGTSLRILKRAHFHTPYPMPHDVSGIFLLHFDFGYVSLPYCLVLCSARWGEEPAEMRMGTGRGDGVSGVFGSGSAHLG